MMLFLKREFYTIFETKDDCREKNFVLIKINYPEYSREPISLHSCGLEERELGTEQKNQNKTTTVGCECLSKFRNL